MKNKGCSYWCNVDLVMEYPMQLLAAIMKASFSEAESRSESLTRCFLAKDISLKWLYRLWIRLILIWREAVTVNVF